MDMSIQDVRSSWYWDVADYPGKAGNTSFKPEEVDIMITVPEFTCYLNEQLIGLAAMSEIILMKADPQNDIWHSMLKDLFTIHLFPGSKMLQVLSVVKKIKTLNLDKWDIRFN